MVTQPNWFVVGLVCAMERVDWIYRSTYMTKSYKTSKQFTQLLWSSPHQLWKREASTSSFLTQASIYNEAANGS